ncbi:MAG: histidine phosphatase family protein [Anaerolineae bacterium]|nr:histidine phosphatase family protein [Anaerolineae bacterium]
MLTIWFVRHAESQANAGERTSQPAHITLTATGWKQAECVALAFTQPPSLIITSPYVRTKQTASCTLIRFPQAIHEEWPVQEFSYLAPGRCVDSTPDERRPMVKAYWERNDPRYVDGDGAESFETLIERVDEALLQLRHRDYNPIAVFSHGQFIQAVLWRLFNHQQDVTAHAMRQFRGFSETIPIPNGGIVEIRFGDDGDEWIKPVTNAHIPPDLVTV